MPQHQPGFIHDDGAGLTPQAPLDPAKEIENGRERVLVPESHQLLDFKYGEIRQSEPIPFGVEQMPQGPAHGVLLEGFADLFVLHHVHEIGERGRRLVQSVAVVMTQRIGVQRHDRFGDGVPLDRRGLHAVQGEHGLDPLQRPGPIPFGLQELEWTKRQLVGIACHGEVQAAYSLRGGPYGCRQGIHRQALVEDKDGHAGIPAQLRGEHS